MKILVTGGAGFIGSHIVKDLLAGGYSVSIFDDFSTGALENISDVLKDVQVVTGDICDYEKLKSAMKGVDFVSHQAAQLEIFRSTDDPYFDLKINTIGTLNVLMAARETGVKKVINASSACIYGQSDGPSLETQVLRPNWAYGISKLAAEQYGHLFSDAHKLPVISLRYGIVYGEREWFRRVLTIFIRRALERRDLVVFGDGMQKRDFIYVGDVVSLHRLCLESETADGHAFNAGTGIATTISELAHVVACVSERAMGFRPRVIFENTPEGSFSELVPYKRRNAAELQSMWLSIEKARRVLGWTPQVALIDGIQKEFSWAASNLVRWQASDLKSAQRNYEQSKSAVV